ncbi:uncharacterized protein METZ01_LOCUS404701, partial [marine metagenome]
SSGTAVQAPPLIEGKNAPETLPNVPQTIGHAPSKLPPPAVPTRIAAPSGVSDSSPPVDTHTTVQKRVASAKWVSIITRDSKLYQAYGYLLAFLAVTLVLNMKLNFLKINSLIFSTKPELIKAVIVIVILWAILSSLGQHLIKPKRYFCGECDKKLSDDKSGQCPGCGSTFS